MTTYFSNEQYALLLSSNDQNNAWANKIIEVTIKAFTNEHLIHRKIYSCQMMLFKRKQMFIQYNDIRIKLFISEQSMHGAFWKF